jgi:hypothetical protein
MQFVSDIAFLLALGCRIEIVAGEGEGHGHRSVHTGRPTMRAIRARLTRERCGGDRWAYAWIKTPYESVNGHIWVNAETGQLVGCGL